MKIQYSKENTKKSRELEEAENIFAERLAHVSVEQILGDERVANLRNNDECRKFPKS